MHASQDKRGKRAPEHKIKSIGTSEENNKAEQVIRYALRTIANKGVDLKGTIVGEAQTVQDFDPLLGFIDKPCGDVVYTIELTAVIKQDAKTPRDIRDL